MKIEIKLRDFLLPFLSAVLLIGAIRPPGLSFLVWVAFVPLLVELQRKPSIFASLVKGYFVGFLYFAVLLAFSVSYSKIVYIKALLLAPFLIAGFSMLCSVIFKRLENDLIRILAPAPVWLSLEYVLSYSSFAPAARTILYSESDYLLQILSITGTSGILFLTLLANGILAVFIMRRTRLSAFALFSFAGLLALSLFYGHLRLKDKTPADIKVAVVQHNLPIEMSWRNEHIKEIISTYKETALRAARQKVNLIVYPQYNLTYDVLRNPELLTSLAEKTGAYILLGTYVPVDKKEPEGKRYNTAVLYSPAGEVAGHYNAVQPPPLRSIGQVTGDRLVPLKTDFARLGVMPCYEDTNPRIARRYVKKHGADILVSAANTGHFNNTGIPFLHFEFDRMRAIENARFAVRAAPNGISAVIDPRGRVLSMTRVGEEKIILEEVGLSRETTLFTKLGERLPPLSFAFTAFLVLLSVSRIIIEAENR